MAAVLSEIEARILGSLVEKSLTTPEQYPLSVKGLAAACCQKTSRDPVMEVGEELVGKSLFPLMQRKLVEQRFEAGSRVPRFKHHIELLLGGDDPKLVGALAVLLLRGPQTPGEIRSRSERLCAFTSTAEVEALLQELCARPDPFIAALPRQPGQKETRYKHLFCGGPVVAAEARPVPSGAQAAAEPSPDDRLTRLEARVQELEARLRALETGERPASAI